MQRKHDNFEEDADEEFGIKEVTPRKDLTVDPLLLVLFFIFPFLHFSLLFSFCEFWKDTSLPLNIFFGGGGSTYSPFLPPVLIIYH